MRAPLAALSTGSSQHQADLLPEPHRGAHLINIPRTGPGRFDRERKRPLPTFICIKMLSNLSLQRLPLFSQELCYQLSINLAVTRFICICPVGLSNILWIVTTFREVRQERTCCLKGPPFFLGLGVSAGWEWEGLPFTEHPRDQALSAPGAGLTHI